MADPATDPTPDDEVEAPPDDAAADPADLDERSRAFVERTRREAAAARRERNEARRELETLQRERETETERLVREAEERGRTAGAADAADQLAAAVRRAGIAEVRAAAGSRFRDPADALAHIPLDELLAEPDDTRPAAITAALDTVLAERPYLGPEAPATRSLVTQGGRSSPPSTKPDERRWLLRGGSTG